jgi:N-acetylmuramoyl-L-alanine amidase
VVIRVGEYEGKPGKRVYLDDIGLYFKDIPTDIKIHKDNRGAYIHEYDLNKKISKRIYNELINKGIKVKYQDTKDRTEDLNNAGKIANESNAKIYLSIHTNYHDNNSSGFFIMSNKGDTQARLIADRLSSSIENNGMIKRRNALLNEGRIGEMNKINNGTIALLLEAGFYSNPNELKHLMSDNYSSYIARHLTNELVKILNELR